jgi:hypothetical protein
MRSASSTTKIERHHHHAVDVRLVEQLAGVVERGQRARALLEGYEGGHGIDEPEILQHTPRKAFVAMT